MGFHREEITSKTANVAEIDIEKVRGVIKTHLLVFTLMV